MPVDDNYTKSLLHFNGIDASTTFVDESGKVWTAAGDAQLDTAQKKLGTASGLFDGTGDYIDTPAHPGFNVGGDDFTIDFWVKRGGAGIASEYFYSQRSAANADRSHYVYLNDDLTVISKILNDASTELRVDSDGAINTDWHHIAFIRHSDTLYLYIDGVAQADTEDATGFTVHDSTSKMTIGRAGEYITDPHYFEGHIDEFRLSKGIARWTANFTPPVREYIAFVPKTYWFF